MIKNHFQPPLHRLHIFIQMQLFILFASFVAYASAGFVPVVPVARTVVTQTVEDYDHHPQYSFNYGVSDSLSGDHKSQHETRDGDKVTGSYSLIDADGTKRIVDYTADDVNGFNAVVRKEPLAVAAPVVKTVAAVAPAATYAAAPAYAYQAAAAPVTSYSAPAVYNTYAAQPLTYVAQNVPIYNTYAASPLKYYH
uniref:Cuticle protein n=1 Tax=Trichogramma kaykai TaxID=54128 RepID=A0ABD2X3H3_9HYME